VTPCGECEDCLNGNPCLMGLPAEICGAALFTKSGKATSRRCKLLAYHPHALEVHTCLPEDMAED